MKQQYDVILHICENMHMYAHAHTMHTCAHPYIQRYIYTYNSVVIIILHIYKDIYMYSRSAYL